MELPVYFAFVIATTFMIALPGPSVLLTVAHSISFGWRHALSTVAGATIGIAVQLMVAAIGLTSLLHTAAEALEWLRWAGAAYLVFLGIKQWRYANEPLKVDTSSVSRSNLLLQGVITTILNPKSLIFIAAFLPQFVDAAQSIAIQFAVIVPTFLVITFSVTSIWAIVGSNVRVVLQSQRAFKSILRTTGGLMVIAGIGLAMARRNS